MYDKPDRSPKDTMDPGKSVIKKVPLPLIPIVEIPWKQMLLHLHLLPKKLAIVFTSDLCSV